MTDCMRRNFWSQDYPALCGLHRQISDNARSLGREGILLRRLRRDRRKGEEYCRRSCAPFALLESRIRNVFSLLKIVKIHINQGIFHSYREKISGTRRTAESKAKA